MKRFLIGAAATAALASGAAAQTAPHEREARAIFERIIGFRTAEGHKQVPAMAEYLAQTLRSAGVPANHVDWRSSMGKTRTDTLSLPPKAGPQSILNGISIFWSTRRLRSR